MKKTIVLALALSMALSLVACSNGTENTSHGGAGGNRCFRSSEHHSRDRSGREYAGGCSGRNHNGG